MSATTATTATAMSSGVGLGFGRLVRSEWIKFRSIRSTWWCYAIIVALTIGLGAMIGAAAPVMGLPEGAEVTQEIANRQIVLLSTSSVGFTVLVAAVLGVLIITGEYGTGQVRSTFTADPGRTGAILAKAVVLAVATFVVSAVATWIGALLVSVLQADKGVTADLLDPAIAMPILGSSVYVTGIALLAFGIGLLVRSSAGGIAIALGVLLVLPIVLQLVAGLVDQQWLLDVSRFLPDQAGSQLYTYERSADQPAPEGVVLNGWSGGGILAAWVVAVGVVALATVKKRDV
ncbi:ABC transporter permease subunit [Curtobacterium sp. RHCJP20]|uniref:ABC transporter permease subunit n=1 Tax=Curtobacterium subtropicum TaxID=3055138 RepID=A0ABT7TDA7_9MICO|nr:ABC transporter permease subunit [Curtobacterium subtropicum]MDM7887548.1 ABC transporter permease subunit [Curtobacterium subtropicum]